MAGNLLEAVLNCGCCGGKLCECDGRCVPLVADTILGIDVPNTNCTDPIPVTLNVSVSAVSNVGGSCFNGSGQIVYKTPFSGGVNCWEGTISGNCLDCNGTSRVWSLDVKMCCPDSANGTIVTLTPGSPGIIIPVEYAVATIIPAQCKPFLASGCIPGDITGFVVFCLAQMTNQVFTDICVTISEP